MINLLKTILVFSLFLSSSVFASTWCVKVLKKLKGNRDLEMRAIPEDLSALSTYDRFDAELARYFNDPNMAFNLLTRARRTRFITSNRPSTSINRSYDRVITGSEQIYRGTHADFTTTYIRMTIRREAEDWAPAPIPLEFLQQELFASERTRQREYTQEVQGLDYYDNVRDEDYPYESRFGIYDSDIERRDYAPAGNSD